MASYDPNRLTYIALRYCNDINMCSNTTGSNQGHGRYVHVGRWEANLYKALGPSWHDYSANKDSWKDALNDLVAWRGSSSWNLPRAYAFLYLPPPFLDAPSWDIWHCHSRP